MCWNYARILIYTNAKFTKETNSSISLQTLSFHFYVNHAIISRLRKISRKIAALVVSSGWKLAFDEATGG